MTRTAAAKKSASPAAAKPKAAPAKAKPAVTRARIVAKPKAPVKAKPVGKTVAAKPKAAIGSGNGAVPMQLANWVKMPAISQAASMAEHKEKVKKPKLVRDSFTMPEAEYQVLGDVKKACLRAGVGVKKSELLRVGVALIRKLDLAKLKEVLAGLPPLKAGRPKREK